MRRSISIASLCLLASLAFVAPAFAGDAMDIAPKGPGTVFESVEAAAIDGLAFAHQVQLQSNNRRVSRGGAIVPVAGGFTYRGLDAASSASPDLVPLRVPSNALAHFHTYPAQNPAADRLNESHSKADRALVDYRDAKHRTSFVLTPSLRVVAYRGSERVVASLRAPDEYQKVAAAR